MSQAHLSPAPIVSENGAARRLTVCSKAGLSNRLKILVSGLALAEATGRSFHMLWPLTAACACPFEQLFENRWDVRTVTEDGVAHFPQLSGWFHQLDDLLNASEDHLEVCYVDWLVKPDIYPGHAQLWERCQQLFGELRPTREIQSRIDAIISCSFRPTMLGIHIRRGDFLRARPESSGNTAAILAAVDTFIVKHPQAGLLLCTDDGAIDPFTGESQSEGLRELFLKRYGERVFIPESRSSNRTEPEAIQDALTELMLLRQTDAIVGTAGSTFSHLAAFAREVPAQYLRGGSPRYRRFELCMRACGIYYVVILCAKLQFKRYIPFSSAWSYYCLKLGKPLHTALQKITPINPRVS